MLLAEIHALVDWVPFERALKDVHSAAKGEAAYPPLDDVCGSAAATLVQPVGPGDGGPRCFTASALRFAGFSSEDETLDHATIWRSFSGATG